MTSLSRQCDPRANVFLMVNLGCEMLYVIDQRLKAQQISEEKAIQVIHDVTVVLLEPKFIDSLIVGSTKSNSQLLTADHCKYMLNDIAISSIMRLDKSSMEKLWNLMTMLYKWQIFISKHPQHLLDISFRHLDGISQLRPDEKRTLLVDFTKNVLLDFWNVLDEEGQWSVYQTQRSWLQCFNTKISLLIRLGLQSLDGTFRRAVETNYYKEFAETIGVNVYVKSVEVAEKQRQETNSDSNASGGGSAKRSVIQLAELLNLSPQTDSEELQPIDADSFQKQFERNLQQCNILFYDMDVNEEGEEEQEKAANHSGVAVGDDDNDDDMAGVLNKKKHERSKETLIGGSTLPDSSTMLAPKQSVQGEFVHLPTMHRPSGEVGRMSALALHGDLLNMYSNLL